MTTATGQFARNYAAAANSNPLTDASLTYIGSNLQVLSFAVNAAVNGTNCAVRYNGAMAGGSTVIKAKLEIATATNGDELTLFIFDVSGNGYVLRINQTAIGLSLAVAGAVGGGLTSATASSATSGDVFELWLTPSTHTLTGYLNGVSLFSVVDSTTTAGLAPGWGDNAQNSNGSSFRSIAADGLATAPPVISSPTPSGTLGTATTATLGATTTQNTGTAYGVVDSAANLSGVTIAQVKLGKKASGAAALSANTAAITTTTPSVGMSGLTPATLYSYAIVQNNGNGDSNLLTGTFTTAAGTPAAVLSAATPSGTLATSTTATLGATSNQTTGTFYGVVDTAANISGVTISQVKLGQRAGGVAAFASSNTAVSSTSPSTAITALVPATLYSYAVVQNNANGDSNLLTGTFTTAAATSITVVNSADSITSASSGNIAHGINLSAITSGTINYSVQTAAISSVVAASTTVTFTAPTITSTTLPFTDINHPAIYLRLSDGTNAVQRNLSTTIGLLPPFLSTVYPISAATAQQGVDSAYHNIASIPANNDQAVWPAFGTNSWLITPETISGNATGRFSISGGTGSSTVFTLYYRVDSTATWYSTVVTFNFNVSANVAIAGAQATSAIGVPAVLPATVVTITGVGVSSATGDPSVSSDGSANITPAGAGAASGLTAPTVAIGYINAVTGVQATSGTGDPTVVITGGASSGTITFRPTIIELLEEAYERATGGQELRTGYQLRTARRSFNFLTIDWQNRGYNFWTIQTTTVAVAQGQRVVYLDPNIMDVAEVTVQVGTVDRVLDRITMPDYANIPVKNIQGPPVQMQVMRTVQGVTLNLWPVPNTAYNLTLYSLRRIQDAGTGATVADIPYRFLPPLVAGLAYYIATKIADAAPRLALLQAQYDDAFQAATEEDRDKGSLYIQPRRLYPR